MRETVYGANTGNTNERKSASYTPFSSLSLPVEANEKPSQIPHPLIEQYMNIEWHFCYYFSSRNTVCTLAKKVSPKIIICDRRIKFRKDTVILWFSVFIKLGICKTNCTWARFEFSPVSFQDGHVYPRHPVGYDGHVHPRAPCRVRWSCLPQGTL